ncbi:acyltransferase family protein [Corynebacterium sp. CCM 9204]|uniref:acyltransferase family protein n=1 Tax=Corynebacterium sp. CCM 9204 TaxID=3057616 RepID=UPI0035251266
MTHRVDEPAPGHLIPTVHRRPNLPSLTGARWWAAAAVFVLHALVFLPVYPFQTGELFATIHRYVPMQLGSAGVTFFFILSGFLIYWSNSGVRGAGEILYYCRRRVTKIYPMHLLSMLLFIAASATVTSSGVKLAMDLSRPELWLPNALLIHTWNPDWAVLGGMNVPSWSLGAEMLFYLSFPFLVPLVNRVSGRGNWIALAVLFLASFAAIFLIHTYAGGTKSTENFFVPRLWPDTSVSPVADVHADPVWFAQTEIPVDQTYWLSYYFPLTRLVEFYFGVFAAKLVWEKRFTNVSITWALMLLAFSYGATWFVPVAFKMSVIMSVPMTIVVATLAVRDMKGISKGIGGPRMVLLGNISFAFYMVQFPVMVFVQRYFIAGTSHGFKGWLGAATVSFILSFIAAWLMFTFVDDPLMKATAGTRGNRRPRSSTTTGRTNVLRRDIAVLLGRAPDPRRQDKG